jgi:hypothetical protein
LDHSKPPAAFRKQRQQKHIYTIAAAAGGEFFFFIMFSASSSASSTRASKMHRASPRCAAVAASVPRAPGDTRAAQVDPRSEGRFGGVATPSPSHCSDARIGARIGV